MKTLERNVFKLLTESISTSEFENYLYQEENINQVKTNKFINDLIDIDYRKTNYINKVKNVAEQHFNEINFLLIELRFSCLKIIETESIDDILKIISKYSIIHCNKNYEYRVFENFYLAKNYLDLIDENLKVYSKKEIFFNVKQFARKYLDAFDLNKPKDELLHFSDLTKYQENLTYIPEEEVYDYLSDRKTDFLSNKKISKGYKSIGFRDSYVENAIEKIEESTISKLKMRFFIYLLTGIPFFYVGIKAYEKKDVFIQFGIIGFAGFTLLIFSIIYLIRIIMFYFKKVKKNSSIS